MSLKLTDLKELLSQSLRIDKHKIEEIVDTFMSLTYIRDTSTLDIDSFVSEILIALNKLDDEDLKPPSTFDKQLKKLLDLNVSPFFIQAKAFTVISEQDKICIGSRIITDIRPIFTEGEDCQIKASAILHNLKLEYMEQGEVKVIYIAVSKNDLEKLRLNINRAEKKEIALREQIKKNDILLIDFSE